MMALTLSLICLGGETYLCLGPTGFPLAPSYPNNPSSIHVFFQVLCYAYGFL